MIDPSGLLGFIYTLYKDYKKVHLAPIDHLDDVLEEPAYKELEAQGHEFAWAKEGKVRKRMREGWEPVSERKGLTQTVFTDRRRELLLLHRKKTS